MLVKRPIYNQQLKCVALEILSPKNNAVNELMAQDLFDLINNSNTQLPLFIPFAFKTMLEQITAPQNPIILKLSADEIESTCSMDELANSFFL